MYNHFRNIFKEKSPSWAVPLLLSLSLVIWVFLFRKLIFSDCFFIIDATPYYQPFKTFILNIRHGIYPLWDPFDIGSTNEFFLRRIGEFNPLYGILIFFSFIIQPFEKAYHFFLPLYYFIGCVGFYCVAKKIFKSTSAALTAFLLLYFSSVGLRIFYCFIIIVFTPLIWFFYFLISFSQTPSRKNFLGLSLFTSVLLSTYVPFYFIVILLTFFLAYILIYFPTVKKTTAQYLSFFRRHFFISLFGITLIVCSLIPSYLFYKAGRSNTFIMTKRTSTMTTIRRPSLQRAQPEPMGGEESKTDSLKVKPYTLGEQGIIIPMIVKDLFADPRQLGISQLFFPFFAFILFFAGAIVPVSRRLTLTALSFFIILMIGQNDGTPVFPFLYEHIFIFRYFRNAYLFIWLALAPFLIFFISDLAARIFKNFETSSPPNPFVKFYIYLIHIGFTLFLLGNHHHALSSYLAIFLSLIFFELLSRKILNPRSWGAFLLLFVIIVLQPMQGYSISSQTYTAGSFGNTPPPRLSFLFSQSYHLSPTYFQNRWLGLFLQADDPSLLDSYAQNRLTVYDRVSPVDETIVPINDILEKIHDRSNFAFVPVDYKGPLSNGTPSPQFIPIKENSELLSVTKYTMNDLSLKTNFPVNKFLVYNESYHPDWRVFINGKQTDLVRANIAFKGVWIPAGENHVHFSFGGSFRYYLGWGLLAGTYFSLFAIIYFFIKEKTLHTKDDDE